MKAIRFSVVSEVGFTKRLVQQAMALAQSVTVFPSAFSAQKTVEIRE